MTFRINIVTALVLLLLSCGGKKEKESMLTNSKVDNLKTVDSATIDLSEVDPLEKVGNSSFEKIRRTIELRRIPLIDSTNFDIFNKTNFFNKLEIKTLQIEKIYPQFYKEGYNYKSTSSYKIDLSEKFHAIVLTTFKGDNEMESALITYDLDGELIDFKVISYDEIAEGWSRKHSKINTNVITIIDEFYGDTKQVDTTKFHINKNGEINQLKTKFSSNLRPNKPVVLNQIYTDSIEFSTYNDDGDYSFLAGKKNGIDISMVYNWEWYSNEKYNFKNGDRIKVEWKMDSIFYAGDGETLDFTERAIDAEKIKNSVKENQMSSESSQMGSQKEMKFMDTIPIYYREHKTLLNVLKTLPETTMASWEWSKNDRAKTVDFIKKNNHLIDSTKMFNNIKYIKPNTIGIQVVDGFWTLSIYEFNDNHYFIVTNDIVGDGNDVQTFNYIDNELKPLKMINWFGDFKYRLLSKNTPNCIELLEGYQLTYDYDFTDKNSVEISSWLLTENESEHCFKGNSIKYKLNKEHRTFDIENVYWKKNSIE